MATLFSLILSAVLFAWQVKDLGSALNTPHTGDASSVAALLYLRMIFIFVCTPFLWAVQIFKFIGWLPWSDDDAPGDVLQMRMFTWTINALLTFIFLWKVAERLFA